MNVGNRHTPTMTGMVYRRFFCIHQNGIFGDGFWPPGNLPALGDRVPLPLANALAPGGMNGSSSSFAIVHMVSSMCIYIYSVT